MMMKSSYSACWLVLRSHSKTAVHYHISCSNMGHVLRNFQCHMSRMVRKLAFCIGKNKDADQLCGNHEADQRPCFRYTDSTLPLLPKSEISSVEQHQNRTTSQSFIDKKRVLRPLQLWENYALYTFFPASYLESLGIFRLG